MKSKRKLEGSVQKKVTNKNCESTVKTKTETTGKL